MDNKSRLILAAILSSTAICSVAQAQEDTRRDFDLPAQELKFSLHAVTRTAGLELAATSEALSGKRAPALKGRYSAAEAIALLLKGTGLTAQVSGRTVFIRENSPSPQSAGEAAAMGPEITVTGSRIRGAVPTSPVVASSREEIERRGITDLGAYARSVPQNYAGGQNPGVIGSVQEGSENFNSSSTLNLRGLGADATLTLINGHRAAYDSVVQGVDISAIPLVAIDRVEIVADGSSALYGSDAVGGVANVILRQDYEGGKISARLGAATEGGDVQQQYNLVTGSRWDGGGFMVAGDFSRSTDVTAGQRSITSTLDGSTTLHPSLNQKSAVLAGHQQLNDTFSFEIDGQFSKRRSKTALAFLATGDFTVNGTAAQRDVKSWSIAPRLKAALPGGWLATLGYVHGRSDSDAATVTNLGGAEFSRNRIFYNNTLDTLEASAEGGLLQLPGGEARLALGGGWRSVSLDANIRSTRGGVTSTLVDYTSGQDVWFGYGELSLPLVGPENSVPLVHRLRLTGAARYEDYQRFGGTTTPKFGVVYEPVSGLAIKGTWGKSFKAPTLAQINKVPEGNLLNASYFVPAAPGGQPVILLGGVSPDLKPEKATTWTATATATPAFAEGLRLEVSYFHTRYKDRVVQPATSSSQVFGNDIYDRLIIYNPTAEQVNAVIAELPLGLVNQTGQAFDPANIGAIVDNSLQNAASQTLEGVDASADYQLTFARGDQLGFNAAVSYLKSNQKLSAGQPTIQRAGTIFDPPHWRARGSATWQRGNFTLSPSITYIGGTLDDRYQPYVRVGSYTSVDAVAQVRTSEAAGFLSGIEVTLSLLNIFNEMPATIRNSSAAAPTYDATNYPVIGRSVSLGLSKAW